MSGLREISIELSKFDVLASSLARFLDMTCTLGVKTTIEAEILLNESPQPDDVEYFRALASMSHLRKLTVTTRREYINLKPNPLSLSIAAVMEKSPCPQVLGIHGNGIEIDDILSFIPQRKIPRVLGELSLSSTMVQRLASSIAKLNTIKKLNLLYGMCLATHSPAQHRTEMWQSFRGNIHLSSIVTDRLDDGLLDYLELRSESWAKWQERSLSCLYISLPHSPGDGVCSIATVESVSDRLWRIVIPAIIGGLVDLSIRLKRDARSQQARLYTMEEMAFMNSLWSVAMLGKSMESNAFTAPTLSSIRLPVAVFQDLEKKVVPWVYATLRILAILLERSASLSQIKLDIIYINDDEQTLAPVDDTGPNSGLNAITVDPRHGALLEQADRATRATRDWVPTNPCLVIPDGVLLSYDFVYQSWDIVDNVKVERLRASSYE